MGTATGHFYGFLLAVNKKCDLWRTHNTKRVMNANPTHASGIS